jgi:hypothetical protein
MSDLFLKVGNVLRHEAVPLWQRSGTTFEKQEGKGETEKRRYLD